MNSSTIAFVFLKMPQIRHRFISHNLANAFPVIRHEVYHAKLGGESYEFFGKSFSGTVHVDDFSSAIREGYISLNLQE